MKVCNDNIVLIDNEKIIIGSDQDHEIYWDSTSDSLVGIPQELGDLTDVNISAPQNNQALIYNSSLQKWENQDQSGSGGFGSDATAIAGILYLKDETRSNKFLSSTKLNLFWGRGYFSSNVYLDAVGDYPSNNSGYRMLRDATITGITVQSENSQTYTIYIRKNGTTSNIVTANISSATGMQDDSIDVNLSQGDRLHCYLSSSNNIQYPSVILEIAWRL